MGESKFLPFYASVVATIQSAIPSSLKDIFNLKKIGGNALPGEFFDQKPCNIFGVASA